MIIKYPFPDNRIWTLFTYDMHSDSVKKIVDSQQTNSMILHTSITIHKIT